MRIGALAVIVVAATSCEPSARPVDQAATPPPASAPSPEPSATPSPSPAPAPAPAPAPTAPAPTPTPTVRSALALEPVLMTALSASGDTVVDPASTFALELAHRLPDARVALLDAADAHVASKDVRELGATTRLTLAPEAHLVPGSRYVLRVDGAAVREMHDADGRAFAPIAFPILVAGSPPPPEPKTPPRKKRRR